MTNIIASDDNIVFQFTDNVTVTGLFNENSNSKLIYIPPSPGESSNKDRWAIITAAGPNVTMCKVGSRVMIKQGMWTPGFTVNGRKFWKSEQKHIIAIHDET